MQFRLVYQGLLKASGASKSLGSHKQQIRRYFHRQLYNLWRTKYPLKMWTEGGVKDVSLDDIANKYRCCTKRFLPVVREAASLNCALDILILRRDLGNIISSGDLDNRVKTLIDALRIPRPGECFDGDEDPLYCLIEDDQLVSEIRVVGDSLFAEPNQIINDPDILRGEKQLSENHVVSVIHVTVKATRYTELSRHFS